MKNLTNTSMAHLTHSHLITPQLDFWLLGGISILFFFASLFMSYPHFHPYELKLLFFLNFIVNFPHFLLSYQLLYFDFRNLIFKKFRFFWAGLIVPIILIGLLFLASAFNPNDTLGYFVNALYFFVGWHYIKQIFGTIIVTNALQQFFYTPQQRFFLKLNLYALWSISWVWNNINGSLAIFEGVIYRELNIPRYWVLCCFGAIILTFIPVFCVHLKKYRKENSKPALPAVICFVSAYFWFIPLFYNPIFFPCIAFFHSLQYLPFVYAFRRNKLRQEMFFNSDKKHQYFFKHYGYLFFSIILGALFFHFLPQYIDRKNLFDFDLYGPTIAMFYFVIFLNIHHYFIDNVIWRKDNEEIKKYLFAPLV